MASPAHHLSPMDKACLERSDKKQKLMSEGSDEENRKSVSEGSGEEQTDSSVCALDNYYCDTGVYYYDERVCDPSPFIAFPNLIQSDPMLLQTLTLTFLFILSQQFDGEEESEVDSDGESCLVGTIAYLRGKFDLEGPNAKGWRQCADFSKLALGKYNEVNGTNYELVEVVKTNAHGCAGMKYYITFIAKDATAVDGVPRVFQACVVDMIDTGVGVRLCMLKPTNHRIRGFLLRGTH